MYVPKASGLHYCVAKLLKLIKAQKRNFASPSPTKNSFDLNTITSYLYIYGRPLIYIYMDVPKPTTTSPLLSGHYLRVSGFSI